MGLKVRFRAGAETGGERAPAWLREMALRQSGYDQPSWPLGLLASWHIGISGEVAMDTSCWHYGNSICDTIPLTWLLHIVHFSNLYLWPEIYRKVWKKKKEKETRTKNKHIWQSLGRTSELTEYLSVNFETSTAYLPKVRKLVPIYVNRPRMYKYVPPVDPWPAIW